VNETTRFLNSLTADEMVNNIVNLAEFTEPG
jgi:hypothetical protein